MNHTQRPVYNRGGNSNIGSSYAHRSDHRSHNNRQAGSGYANQQDFGKSGIRPSKSHSQNSHYGSGYYCNQSYQHQRTVNPQQPVTKHNYTQVPTNNPIQFHQNQHQVPMTNPAVKSQTTRTGGTAQSTNTSAAASANLPKVPPKDCQVSAPQGAVQHSVSQLPGLVFQHNIYPTPYLFEMPSPHQHGVYLNPNQGNYSYQMFAQQYSGTQQFILHDPYYIVPQGTIYYDYPQTQASNVPQYTSREKKALQIVNPDTGADIMKDISHSAVKSKSESSNTSNISLQESSHDREIAAQFATAVAKVAATLDVTKKSTTEDSRNESPSENIADQEQTNVINEDKIPDEELDISTDCLESQCVSVNQVSDLSDQSVGTIGNENDLNQCSQDESLISNSSENVAPEIVNDFNENDLSFNQNKSMESTTEVLLIDGVKKSNSEILAHDFSTTVSANSNNVQLSDEVHFESKENLNSITENDRLKTPDLEDSTDLIDTERDIHSISAESFDDISSASEDQQTDDLHMQKSIANLNEQELTCQKHQTETSSILAENETSPLEISKNIELVNDTNLPINVSSKDRIQYDRNELLKYRSHPVSLNKPSCLMTSLANIVCIIKDKPSIQDSPAGMSSFCPQSFGADPFMPSYMSHVSTSYSGTSNRRIQSRCPKIISTSLSQPVKLHESQNAWKPSHSEVENKDSKTDKEESEKIYKKVRSILNKLTPDNYEKMCNNFSDLAINTENRLREVTDIVFEKAVGEKEFTKEYAKLCSSLKNITVTSNDGGKSITFNEILLKKCQQEFESDKSIEALQKEKLKEIDLAETEEKKIILKEQWDEEEAKYKRKSVGYIKFIGYLFSEKLLSSSKMHSCLNKLLTKSDEESLEQLCNLLKTVGKRLEEEEKESKVKKKKNKSSGKKATMVDYIAKIQQLIKKKQVSSRVRFMLEGIVELREKKWVPRREEIGPKQISEIHKDIEKEKIEAQKELERFNQQKTINDQQQRKSSRYNSLQHQPILAPSYNSEWSTMTRRGRISMPEPPKLCAISRPTDSGNIVLQPAFRQQMSWASGSTGGGKRKEPEPKVPVISQVNRFQLLSSTNGQMEMMTDQSVSNKESISNNETTEKEVQDSSPDEVSNSVTSNIEEPMSLEKVEQKIKATIDELLVNLDYEEAICCVQELAHPNTNHSVVTFAINYILERTNTEREILAKLLYNLVKKDILSMDDYIHGLKSVLEFAEDYVVDIPLIWKYMAELIEPMLDEFTILGNILEPCIANGTSSKLAIEILQVCTEKKGSSKVKAMWQQSELQWKNIFGETVDAKKLLQSNSLEYLFCETGKVMNMPLHEVKNNLDIMLKGKQSSNQEIIEWLEANIGENTTDSQFIRILVTSVIESALVEKDKSLKVEESVVKYRNALLKKFLEQDEKLELQALYALQALMNHLNHPRGVLRHIFDLFYDEDVVAEESYRLWEKTEDPAEHAGRGVTLLSVSSFFSWLASAEMSSEDIHIKKTAVL